MAMLHPSYTDLMNAVNADAIEEHETPVVNSRYSIVMATAKRARQIVSGSEPFVEDQDQKPLSMAVQELYQSKITILPEETEAEE